MNKIKSIWNSLSLIGVRHVQTLHDKKAVIIMNRMSFVLAFFMLVFVVNAFVLKDYLIVPFASFFCINFLIAPLLLHRGFFLTAKWFFALTPIIEVAVISIINGEKGADKFYLMTTGVIPVLVFRSKWLGFLFFELSLACLFLVSYLQTKIPPFVDVAPEIMTMYQYTNYLVICFILYLFTRYFKNDTERIEQELVLKNDEISEKHKEITDSINYAERIQRSFMATQEELRAHLPQYFLYFNPKEAVSGDFYWAGKSDQHFCVAVADSTGHGVPGAIMSILNITCLENAVKDGLTKPCEILDHTRKNIIGRLKKDGSNEGGKDGMDCTLLSFDFKNRQLSFALANNPLWLFRHAENGFELTEFAPDKMPVGKHDHQHIPFTHMETEISKGDWIFLFTDGFPDQFGGPKGKKFKYANLKKIISENLMLEPHVLRTKLQQVFDDWKGNLEQTDDVCLMGIKI